MNKIIHPLTVIDKLIKKNELAPGLRLRQRRPAAMGHNHLQLHQKEL